MKFKTFLLEGGNNTINGAEAQPIPITGPNSISRSTFRSLLIDALRNLNDGFKRSFGNALYNNFSVVEKGKVFAGSTAAFVNPSVSDDAYSLKKPKIGDIDLQVNKEHATDLKEFLSKNVNKKFGELTFKGFKDGGLQLITIFQFPPKYKNIPKFFQLDMELVKFKGDTPTDISLFMRSSHWDDIQKNIKGTLHKFLLQSMMVTDERFHVINKKGLKKVANGESLDEKDVKKGLGNKIIVLGPEGVREKYKLIVDSNNKPVMLDGKRVFEELAVSDSKMITDMNKIFEIVTKKKATKENINSFGSFVGILDLLKKFKTPSKDIEFYISNFSKSMWKSGLRMSKNDKEDMSLKMAGWDELKKMFPKEHANVMKEIEDSNMIDNFYNKETNTNKPSIDDTQSNVKEKMFQEFAKKAATELRDYDHAIETFNDLLDSNGNKELAKIKIPRTNEKQLNIFIKSKSKAKRNIGLM